MAQPPKIIKRYQNRKLYDTTRSRYVTLWDLAKMIQQGEDLRVMDNQTNEDITCATLTQIIFETEKKSNHLLPLHLLQDIIKSSGGSISSFFEKTLKSGFEKTFKSGAREIAHVKGELQKKLDALTGKIPLQHEIEKLQRKIKQLEKKNRRPETRV
ncbi:MAG: polyhydroxyalkanoate synthesis regulator DNA-binding domain-containing protein [Deltaproteobacteria bacterium]|nr:polyhydroxyalkanoate synthesis regulator DNA-binding domain-containing protein [Deltaproteobacteria bacterium]